MSRHPNIETIKYLVTYAGLFNADKAGHKLWDPRPIDELYSRLMYLFAGVNKLIIHVLGQPGSYLDGFVVVIHFILLPVLSLINHALLGCKRMLGIFFRFYTKYFFAPRAQGIA